MNQILVYFKLKVLLSISRPLSKGTINTQCYNEKADQGQTLQFNFISIVIEKKCNVILCIMFIKQTLA